jgi:uncharacterized protein
MVNGSLDLLDINVWLALVDQNHQHHGRAAAYWKSEAAEKLAFCRVTMLGLLRLLTHKKVMREAPLSPDAAWAAYRTFASLPEVVFLSEQDATERLFAGLSDDANFTPHRWTDAWLAALAKTCGARLVSFDRDFQAFQGIEFLHLRENG